MLHRGNSNSKEYHELRAGHEHYCYTAGFQKQKASDKITIQRLGNSIAFSFRLTLAVPVNILEFNAKVLYFRLSTSQYEGC